MARTDWIVIDASTGGTFVCLRCKGSYKPTLPVSVTMLVAMSDAFTAEHRDCEETESVEADRG